MGITTPLSTNPAMTIGGLTVGVTPLDMAHAYETLAHGGQRVSGSLAEHGGPVGIQEVDGGGRTLPDGSKHDVNRVETERVLPASIAATETSMLETVVQYGTGRAAALGQFAAGKTGTTSNYGDAWFVGWNSKYTVAVWVGYPDKLVPMTTEFNGQPVLGGTFPALIWHQFMVSAETIDKARAENTKARLSGGTAAGASGGEETGTTGGGSGESGTSTGAKTPGAGGTTSGGRGGSEGTGASKEGSAGSPPPEPSTPSAPSTGPPSSSGTGSESGSGGGSGQGPGGTPAGGVGPSG
jgi:penicillin-binding protein 1A